MCNSKKEKACSRLRRAFTLAEILIVLAVMGIVSVLVVFSFSTITGREALFKKTDVVLSLLRSARGFTLSAKDASVYGVHFESGKAVLFTGSTYSADATSNKVELVSPSVSISSVSLAGGGSDVVFNQFTGETAQYGTVTLSLVASSTQKKTITIFSTGISESN
ncbi:MAG: type II secretion system GspH family protein [Candidatus Taylorbacteria bacterium]|nr:type II secretion system GspH family protein [Candidatus Taylorbacteria bacterium]